MIRLIKQEDIKILAKIYKELYDDADIWEFWSIESAENLLNYRYNKQPDLFFVAEENWEPVWAIVSWIKPRFDWNRLIDTELFVDKNWQKKYIWKQLFQTHISEAKKIYNTNIIEFHTYGDETEFPQNWYKRIWCKKDEELIIMNAKIESIIKNLE